jgi:hypothetical protein
MNESNQLYTHNELDSGSYAVINKGKVDLVVLKYMAQRVRTMLCLLDTSVSMAVPLLHIVPERHGRMHRMVFYEPDVACFARIVIFVGFVSKKQANLSQAVNDDIQLVDKMLVAELADSPGLLSYSSLELRNGNWYNLVLLSDADAKKHIRNADTHVYAAYQLAPRYYEWIRLHSGVMPDGLAPVELVLQKTRYFVFQRTQLQPVIREMAYDI